MQNAIIFVTYGALFLVVVELWFRRRIWVTTLCAAIVIGDVEHVLDAIAVLWIVAMAGVCIAYDWAKGRAQGWQRASLLTAAALGILVLGVLLGMHALPGFHNFKALDNVVLSDGAAPYTLYLNFDKTVVGIFILGICYRGLLTRRDDWSRALRRAAPRAVITIVAVAAGAMAIGYLTWQPKWTPIFWIWAPVNLFFTCFSEEAFFRGFIQRELTLALANWRFGSGVAIGVSAVLFGLAHFGGGMSYVVLAMAAGVGYAIVFHVTRSIEMSILTHFGLNATHFLLFTYPALNH